MKYIKYISASVILITAAFILLGFEEIPFLDQLKKDLFIYNSKYPEEKIYLQLDKPFYKPGEDIWFSSFLINSTTHKPSSISNVMYVELIDPKGNSVSKLDLYVKEGSSHGDFKLAETAPGGLYKIKAYTRWMSNFDDDKFFHKTVQVQRVITPGLLLKLDFEKEAYGPGDSAVAELTIRNLKDEKVTHGKVNFTAKVSGIEIQTGIVYSDTEGIAKLKIKLPTDLNSADGLLNAIVSDAGVEESISRSIPIVLNKISLQFFPEGGELTADMRQKIAFKAVNEFGKAADVSGLVRDENGNEVAAFESFHMGMGTFILNAEGGKRYYADITRPIGKHERISLPAVNQGYALGIKLKTINDIKFNIYSPVAAEAYVVGHVHGKIYYAEHVTLKKGTNELTADIKNFPCGIASFTLFDGNGTERCERLTFVHQEKQLSIQIKTDKKHYQPREKVEVSIETKDESGEPVPVKLSLAAVDDKLISFADDKQDNILSWFLMSSELKGEIQEPSFYFDKTEVKAEEALDNLLLTQGWRRFVWKELPAGRSITELPENENSLSGLVVDQTYLGQEADVTLLELNNKRRIAKVRSTKNGQFVFRNIDATAPVLLLTKKSNTIIVPNGRLASPFLSKPKDRSKDLRTIRGETFPPSPETVIENPEAIETLSGQDLDMAMQADVTQLSEVIVTGYGSQDKRDLTGSVVSIRPFTVAEWPGTPSFEQLLQGRVAGLQVSGPSGNPGSKSIMHIRGINSLGNGQHEPLYIIDGHPIGTGLNNNFSSGSIIGVNEIASIEVMNSPEATAIYGSRAINGVILIETKSRLGVSPYSSKEKESPYNALTVFPRKFSNVREFYVPARVVKKDDTQRTDFRTTAYWNPNIITDQNGKAKVTFYNTDATTSFRLTAEGISATGLIGRKEETIFTQLPLSLSIKIPEFLGFEDSLRLPIRISNATHETISGKLAITAPKELFTGNKKLIVEVSPESTTTVFINIHSTGVEGKYPINVHLEGNGFTDDVSRTIEIHSIGFPRQMSFSAREMDKTFNFSVDDAEKGSLKAEFNAFPDILSSLFTGAESIFREPYGCFEQVSSTTFPNILALQFMKSSGTIMPAIEQKALAYIDDGYKRLKAYEIKGGGFEWFGHPPAHEGLTAYGLLEFNEMKKVYNKVDEALIVRSIEWLLSRRDGKGGFKQNKGKYGFSSASEEVNNAYIVYALTETGNRNITVEYENVLREVSQSNDMYRMALTAIAAYDLGKQDDYKKLINYFLLQWKETGADQMKMDHSVVYGQGVSLKNETIGFWVQALAKEGHIHRQILDQCVEYLLSHRQYGGFGSTQATTVSLQALTTYANLVRVTSSAGEIRLVVNNTEAEKMLFAKDQRDKLVMNKFSGFVGDNGQQSLRVAFDKTPAPLPYSINLTWNSKTPASDEHCKVKIKTFVDNGIVKMNETVRLSIELTNKTQRGLPMTMAIIGIPAGLAAQPWQLKEMQEKGVFDFYEIINDRIAFYYRELGPGAVQHIKLDLKAELPGIFTGTANSAYLYYTNENKDWEKGFTVRIKQ